MKSFCIAGVVDNHSHLIVDLDEHWIVVDLVDWSWEHVHIRYDLDNTMACSCDEPDCWHRKAVFDHLAAQLED